MPTDLKNAPNYDGLISTLHKLSLEGKLKWQLTAAEGVYLVSVKGQQSFRISITETHVTLDVMTAEGKMLYKVNRPKVSTKSTSALLPGNPFFPPNTDTPEQTDLYRLFLLAKRIAEGIDEKVESTLNILNGL